MQRLYDKLQTFSDHFLSDQLCSLGIRDNFVRWVFATRSEYIANNYCKQCSSQHIRQIFAQRQLFRKGHVQWSGTIYAILKEGIIGNIHVKLYEIKTRGSGVDVI